MASRYECECGKCIDYPGREGSDVLVVCRYCDAALLAGERAAHAETRHALAAERARVEGVRAAVMLLPDWHSTRVSLLAALADAPSQAEPEKPAAPQPTLRDVLDAAARYTADADDWRERSASERAEWRAYSAEHLALLRRIADAVAPVPVVPAPAQAEGAPSGCPSCGSPSIGAVVGQESCKQVYGCHCADRLTLATVLSAVADAAERAEDRGCDALARELRKAAKS